MRRVNRWCWHLDEVLVKIRGGRHFWRAVDHEGEVLEAYVTKKRHKSAALNFLRKAMKRCVNPEVVVTDKRPSYQAAMKVIGNGGRQETGRHLNNRAGNSHQPFRRRERATSRFTRMRSLQKFASKHSSVHNHFNHQRNIERRAGFK
jgi:putative transposase